MQGDGKTSDLVDQGGEWFLSIFFALPEDTDAFMMQTGVSQKVWLCPSLHLTGLIEEDEFLLTSFFHVNGRSTVAPEGKSSMLEAGQSSILFSDEN
jgi:hypothetical protein